MNRFSAGLIAGSVIGAIGLGIAVRDKHVRKRLMKDTKRLANKCANTLECVTDKF